MLVLFGAVVKMLALLEIPMRLSFAMRLMKFLYGY